MKSYVYHSATATAHALIEHLIAMMGQRVQGGDSLDADADLLGG